MIPLLTIHEAGLHVVIATTTTGELRLLHCSALPFDETKIRDEAAYQHFPLFALQVAGEDTSEHHGNKHSGALPGKRLRYVCHRDLSTVLGRKVEIEAIDDITGLLATAHLQCFTGLPVLRAWITVTNTSQQPFFLEYLASFILTGLAKEGTGGWGDKMLLHIPHNTWQGEGQWRQYSLPELGLSPVAAFSLKRIAITNLGTWSAEQYLPLGVLENSATHSALAWQIEHHGSWHWEISDVPDQQLYLHLSGPTMQEHQWGVSLKPGTVCTSVPVGVVVGMGDGEQTAFEQVIGTLTRYRRVIRRPNTDNQRLPVIFNDYMNCLNADPTTEKEIPLIHAAAAAGCEVYCIDAGWYADLEENWWETVGAWQPSSDRFGASEGLVGLLNLIRTQGMIPGLWLELEVVGINSSLSRRVPDAWFFCRHGKRVIDHGRYQLDFRHPDVQTFANEVIARLVHDYGVGYIKMDYNINAGAGTEVSADSVGDGLLGHQRAYLAWLDAIFERYPDLVIENCSSGGLRMDYALLSRHSIQSTSDQTDYRMTSVIAATAPTAVTPEQGAVWAYPLAADDHEAVVSNLVNALLGRVHLSGQLVDLTPEAFALVQEGIEVYKHIRQDLAAGLPFWPLGLPTFQSGWASLGLACGSTIYLAVWRRSSSETTVRLHLPVRPGQSVQVTRLYPAQAAGSWACQGDQASLMVHLPSPQSARLFRCDIAAC